jgi:hypothetical protein
VSIVSDSLPPHCSKLTLVSIVSDSLPPHCSELTFAFFEYQFKQSTVMFCLPNFLGPQLKKNTAQIPFILHQNFFQFSALLHTSPNIQHKYKSTYHIRVISIVCIPGKRALVTFVSSVACLCAGSAGDGLMWAVPAAGCWLETRHGMG